jgi:ankyrin repeat protein
MADFIASATPKANSPSPVGSSIATFLNTLQTSDYHQWQAYLTPAHIDQVISGIEQTSPHQASTFKLASLKTYFKFMDFYLRKGKTLTNIQAKHFRRQIEAVSPYLFTQDGPLDPNTLSILENSVVALNYLHRAPYQYPLEKAEIAWLHTILQKMQQSPHLTQLEQENGALRAEWLNLFVLYFHQKQLTPAEKVTAIESLLDPFLLANNLQLQASNLSHDQRNYTQNLSWYFLRMITQQARRLNEQHPDLLDITTLRQKLNQQAQILLDKTKNWITQHIQKAEIRSQALQDLKEDYYLNYLQFVYTPQELAAIQSKQDHDSLLKPEDIQIISQASKYPNQKSITILSSQAEQPALEVELHYNALTKAQLEDIQQKFKESYQHFIQAWWGNNRPQPAETGPIKIKMYVADNRETYQRLSPLLGYDGNNGGYALPSAEQDSHHANTYVYQENNGNAWHIRNAEHELAHGLTYYLLGKKGLNLKFPAFIEGLGEYHAHEKDCAHQLDFLKRFEAQDYPSLQAILDMDYSQGAALYHWGHFLVGYMIETQYPERDAIIQAFQSQNEKAITQHLQRFAQTEQAGFVNWLHQRKQQTKQACSVGFPQKTPITNKENTMNTNPHQTASEAMLYEEVIHTVYQYTITEAKQRNLDTIRGLLKKNQSSINPPTAATLSYTPLHYAITAREFDAELIQLLCQYGADPTQADHQGRTAQDLAKVYSRTNELEYAIQSTGFSLIAPASPQSTMQAPIKTEHLSQQASTQSATLDTWEAAKNALIQQDSEQFKHLLPQLGSTIIHTDAAGKNLFHYLAAYGLTHRDFQAFSKQLQAFLEAQGTPTHGDFGLPGASPKMRFSQLLNASDHQGNTPLHLAIQQDNAPMMQTIYTQGGNNSKTNHASYSPEALAKKNTRLTSPLQRMQRTTSIMGAIRQANMKQALELLQAPARIYRQGMSFDIWHREKGPSHYAQTVSGANLLHYAVQYFASDDVLRAIIQKNIAVDSLDSLGNTPLHYAVLVGNPFAVQTLIEQGASITRKNRAGKTPLDLADASLRLEIQSLQPQIQQAYSVPRIAVGG